MNCWKAKIYKLLQNISLIRNYFVSLHEYKNVKMKKLTCALGAKFGDWTILDEITFVKSGHTYVKVQCKCGKIEDKCLSDLVHGRTSSCRSCAAQSRGSAINIGDQYKHWTVISGPKLSNYSTLLYEVQCDCGSTKFVQANELLDPTRNFQCMKCASKEKFSIITLKNGRVGELTKTRYSKLVKSAKTRGIEFLVSMEYLWNLFIAQNNKCAITGDELHTLMESSLDRIDSTKGYVEGNVQWVTIQANLSKHIMSMEELLQFCNKVINHANQQPSTPLTKCEGSETNS